MEPLDSPYPRRGSSVSGRPPHDLAFIRALHMTAAGLALGEGPWLEAPPIESWVGLGHPQPGRQKPAGPLERDYVGWKP